MGRIVDYPEITTLSAGDYLIVDNAEGGTKKVPAQSVAGTVDPTLTQSRQAADAKVVGDKIGEIREIVGGGEITIVPTSEYEKLGKSWVVSSGTMLASTTTDKNYNACSPIDISGLKDGTEVKILASLTGAKAVAITDENMIAFDYVNGNNAIEKGYSPTSKSQIVTFTKVAGAKYIVSTLRAAYYTGVTDFTVYGTAKDVVTEIQKDISRLEDDVSSLASEKSMSATVNNGACTLLTGYGENSQLEQTLSYGKRNNGLFEFEHAYIVTGGTQTHIKDSTDDITPMRLGANGDLRTVGANHGWHCFTVNVGALTQADVGSTWTDGTNNYILAKVDNTNGYFIFPASLVDGQFIYTNTLPASNMTHVRGATHTSDVDISGASSGNLYPSVNNWSCKMYADGAEITSDGTYDCDTFTVKEQYNIMDYADIGDFLSSNIGGTLGDNAIRGCVRVSVEYRFKNTACVISTSYEALETIEYVNCGVLQSIKADNTGKSLYRYLNGVGSSHPFNSENVVDITSDSDGYMITPSDLAEPNVPTNRSVDLVKSNGAMDWGFCFGFLPDVSKGSNAQRKTLSQIWSLRSDTKKSYPVVFYDNMSSQGSYADIIGYRNYLKPNLDITNLSVIEVGRSVYVIIDAHDQKTNYAVPIGDEYIGKTVSVLESTNFALSSDIVGAKGIVFSTTDTYGCAILKVV